jgi:two-component system sensor histidine kinase TctE
MVTGQARMLREMVSNLVDNALRYTLDGGRVALRVAEVGGAVVLDVQDSGCGIAEAEREKAFTPFYRSPASFELNPSGTGLGLAIVRDIARVHHAAVTLGDAAPGPGLKVSVRFERPAALPVVA